MEAESPNVAHQRAEQIVQQLLHNPIVDTYHIHPPIEQAPSPSPQHSR
jgi:phosphoribosylformylglycinamidine (FGAM) synthase PurS component